MAVCLGSPLIPSPGGAVKDPWVCPVHGWGRSPTLIASSIPTPVAPPARGDLGVCDKASCAAFLPPCKGSGVS